MIDLTNLNIYHKLVTPYYERLMGVNFMDKTLTPSYEEFLIEVRNLYPELSHEDLTTLLHYQQNWRPSKVGAWIIGLNHIAVLEEELIKYLMSRPTHCEHVIINIALFNTEKGIEALKSYIVQQLNNINNILLKNNGWIKAIGLFETNSVTWAFHALAYLDKINHKGFV